MGAESLFKGLLQSSILRKGMGLKSFQFLISGCAGSLLLHAGFLQLRRVGSSARRCTGFSLRRLLSGSTGPRHADSSSYGAQVAPVAHRLQSACSVVAARGLSYSEARGIFLDQRANAGPLHWPVDSYPPYHPGRSEFMTFNSVNLGEWI